MSDRRKAKETRRRARLAKKRDRVRAATGAFSRDLDQFMAALVCQAYDAIRSDPAAVRAAFARAIDEDAGFAANAQFACKLSDEIARLGLELDPAILAERYERALERGKLAALPLVHVDGVL